jgi:beta-glucosidase
MSNPALTPLERANELLARMTLAEKAGQVSAVMVSELLGAGGLSEAAMAGRLADGIGHVSGLTIMAQSPGSLAASVNAVQRFLVEKTRLGIPAMVHGEALNGVVAPGFTSFPTAIGLAATWDTDAIREMTGIIGRQLRAAGIRQALSPVMDIARDARWGRVHETYGEDVYLASAMSVAFTQGLQGTGGLQGTLAPQGGDLPSGVLATGKHFLGYSMAEGGQNMAATHLGSRELYDVYATPFEAAIKLAGLASVMNSYSEVDGVPLAASREILTGLLRGRMGFTGSVVSDYASVEFLHTRQRVAASPWEAGVLALSAGLDVELPKVYGYGTHLEEAVRSGTLAEDVLDEAVRRVLVDKFRAGLFEDPYAVEEPVVLASVAREGDALSRRLAQESVTLLKNDGLLPLPATVRRIAVIGPNGADVMASFAAYTGPSQLEMLKNTMTGQVRMAGVDSMREQRPEVSAGQAEARRAMLAAIDPAAAARDIGALSLADAVRAQWPDAEVSFTEGVGISPGDPADIGAAVAAARDADVVIAAIGGRGGWFGHRITEGEGTDIARIELPAAQVELIRAVASTGTPVAGVVCQGRPYALTEIDDLVAALAVVYYPGPHGARATAAILAGDASPGGRLPYSIPRATGQLPLYYSHKHGSGYRRGPGDQWADYIDLSPAPLYPFGHGLDYTSFEYGDVTASADAMPAEGGQVTVSVPVRNTGSRDGVEVVQLYAAVTVAGITRPALQLAGFRRVPLRAAGEAIVSFRIAAGQLGYSGADGRFTLQPGTVTFSAGASSADLRGSVTIAITGQAADLEGRRSYLSTSAVTPALSEARA